ncbi:macrolide family glycosyltransferase [Actinoalloteichus hymeniacidonis]|uniref:Glycosyltransferase, MGT family n=1 Tax=Actinoalloteichus hymeniacidonis TaxID=340345 RepID=A0AAC9MY69_9PSEU|nr:macrolide family glycosyltransferase [Actinoalloteichus hymeniacidonis]AOS62985.1 glycosyltransferase, MGT family [Actinoalloteichus hymeniacidonis]MBB5908980.1 MGT family glycosyltransferase [Actinoalloteichus hymeniacidonis]
MALIAFFGPAGAGHINPTLGLVTELVRRGHRVIYCAPREYADRILETGAEHHPTVSTWKAHDQAQQVPQMHGKELVRAMRLLLEETKAILPVAAQVERPDLVVHDGTLAWWGRILAQRWQVPSVETWPNFVSNAEWSMAKNYTTINPFSPRFLLQTARIARFLRSEGVTSIGRFFNGDEATSRLVLLPRAFQYEGDTFGGTFQFVGPMLTERSFQADWQPTASPVTLIALGTAYNARPEFYRMVLESAADRPGQIVMAIGDVDRELLGPVPPNVEIHRQVPQLAVLRHAQAFVTHAGMGSTMESLSHSVPMVALPQMAEQRANADRIVDLGLGRALDPEVLTAEALWEAVDGVMHDPGIRDRLAWMRGEIAESGGAASAADTVENLLPSGDPKPE